MNGSGEYELMYRWYSAAQVTPNQGGAVRAWTRGHAYWVSVHSVAASQERTASGIRRSVVYKMIVNDTDDFKLGDRVGDADGARYEITAIRTFSTFQQMEAVRCA